MINPDDQAFPNVADKATAQGAILSAANPGMTIRTYIATQVLAASINAYVAAQTADVACANAVKWADALIAELNKKP